MTRSVTRADLHRPCGPGFRVQWQCSRAMRPLLMLALAVVLLPSMGMVQGSRTPSQQQPSTSLAVPGARVDANSTVLVGGVDGVFTALHAEDGTPRWSLSTGDTPLVTSSVPLGPEATSHVLIPSLDGRVYLFLDGQMEQTPILVQDLLHRSPHVSSDGMVYIASKTSVVFVVDPLSGRVSSIYGDLLDDNMQNAGLQEQRMPESRAGDADACQADSARGSLFLSRTTYQVRAVDAATGIQRWNISVGELSVMSRPPDDSTIHSDAGSTAGLPAFLVSPQHHVLACDPVTRSVLWNATVSSAPVAVFTVTAGNQVHAASAVSQQGTKLFVHDQRLLPSHARPGSSSSSAPGPVSVYVGEINGQLYALTQHAGRVGGADDDSGLSVLLGDTGLGVRQPLGLPSPDDVAISSLRDACSESPSTVHCVLGPHKVYLDGDGDENCDGGDNCDDEQHAVIVIDPAHVSGDGDDDDDDDDEVLVRVLPRSKPQTHKLELPPFVYLSATSVVTLLVVIAVRLPQQRGRGTVPTAVDAPAGPRKHTARNGAGRRGKAAGQRKTQRRRDRNVRSANEDGQDDPDAVEAGDASDSRDGESAKLEGKVRVEEQAEEASEDAEEAEVTKEVEDWERWLDDEAEHAIQQPAAPTVSVAAAEAKAIPSGAEKRAAVQLPYRLGQLTVFQDRVLGYGSQGTIVYEGEFGQRRVAVKRMLSAFYQLAHTEVSLLLESDEHRGVVRYFAKESDSQFVYLALEHCPGTLCDVVERNRRDGQPVVQLLDARGRPTPIAYRMIGELIDGVAHLHDLNICHRDLKPQNILVTSRLSVKISDMGLGRKLDPGQNSFATNSLGSLGWIAPEVMRGDRLTKQIDVFSVGCLIFYMLTGGKHAFGDRIEREMRIRDGAPVLRPLQHLPAASDLVRSLLHVEPAQRPALRTLHLHPFFWSVDKQLNFLNDASDRLEVEKESAPLVIAFERHVTPRVLGEQGDWAARVDQLLLDNLGKYRKYKYGATRDLLRVIRNKRNHFRDMPPDLQSLMGPLPMGFHAYFTSRFPVLVIETYRFLRQHCFADRQFDRYFADGPR